MNKNLQSKIERFSYYAENCVNYVTATIKEKHNHRKTSETLTKLYEKKKKTEKQVVNERPSVWQKKSTEKTFFQAQYFFLCVFAFFPHFSSNFSYFQKEKPKLQNKIKWKLDEHSYFWSINCIYVHTWEVEKKTAATAPPTATAAHTRHTLWTHYWVSEWKREVNKVVCVVYKILNIRKYILYTTNFDAIRFFFYISLLAFVNFSIRLLWTILYIFFVARAVLFKAPVYWTIIV